MSVVLFDMKEGFRVSEQWLMEEIGRRLLKKWHFGLHKKKYAEISAETCKAETGACKASHGAVSGVLSVLEDLKESSVT